MMHPSDADVIGAVLRGDTGSFRHLVLRYQDIYRRYATRVLGSADDADDALQLAFVRAFRNLASCRNPDRFGAWFYQIVLNECRTLAARRARREGRMADDSILKDLPAPAPRDSLAAELQEIQRALDQLDHDQREAFVLKYVEDLSYEEMSELTGVGISALKMRVKRACARLRELLEKVAYDQ